MYVNRKKPRCISISVRRSSLGTHTHRAGACSSGPKVLVKWKYTAPFAGRTDGVAACGRYAGHRNDKQTVLMLMLMPMWSLR